MCDLTGLWIALLFIGGGISIALIIDWLFVSKTNGSIGEGR